MDVVAENHFFPHEKIRGGQDELIKDLRKTFNDKKVLLAHAPTGLGKTASALSVALEFALEKKKRVFFLTNRHTQHQIAINTLKDIQKKTGEEIITIDLIGKKWMCNQEVASLFANEFNEYCKAVVEKGECEFYSKVKTQKKEITVEAKKKNSELKHKGPLHNEELINSCKEEGFCSYEMALLLAKEAKVLIGDYNYLFNPFIQDTILKKMNIEVEDIILILDEGHNLPGRVAEMMSSMLTSNMIKNGIIEAKKFGFGGVISWLQELNRILNQLANFSENQRFDKEHKVAKGDFISEVKKVTDYDILIQELEIAADEIREKQRRSYLGGIAGFLEAWKGEDEGYLRYIAEKSSRYGPMLVLYHACLDPSLITRNIFQRVYSGVVMSGTLKPTFMYKDVLGIERAVEKDYQSPFPIENKLSIVVPETSTKFTLRNDLMFQNIAEKLGEMSRLIPGNVALFFPSYDMRDKIGLFFRSSKKIFWEKNDMNKEEKENFLANFKAEKDKGGVLLGVAGANFAEGIDLPGDLLNGVVVVGLPLAKPDLVTRENINYYDKRFSRGWDYGYIYPAMSKCIQSAGRCIRSENDRGVIIYLDERFAWQNYFMCLPREGLIVTKNYAKLLEEFFFQVTTF